MKKTILVIEDDISILRALKDNLTFEGYLVTTLSDGAAGLQQAELRDQVAHRRHEAVDVHLIYKLGTGKPRKLEEVIGRSIEVLSGSSHSDMLTALGEAYPELEWRENADVEVADLMTRVADGELDFTVSDSTDFGIHEDVQIARTDESSSIYSRHFNP